MFGMDPMLVGYVGLFAAAFVAATLVPAQSEIILGAMVLSGRYDLIVLVLVATVGNVLGSIANWMVGHFLGSRRDARWFPVSRSGIASAERWFNRWGQWSLLFSWLPVVGDPLTLVAGVLRMSLSCFILLVTIAKGGRYAIVAGVVTPFAAA